jgi:hypothetical protein
MDSKVEHYILSQPSDRQSVLADIHSIILREDKAVVPIVEPMMGKEMIVYKSKGSMKYALASVKKHMSLHLLPMYISKPIYSKYETLLTAADFQKGCINFNLTKDMPLEIVTQLIADCSAIDPVKIREDYLKEKKEKSKVKE